MRDTIAPFTLTVLLVASTLAFTAGPAPAAPALAEDAHVHITGFAYAPTPLVVAPGTTVTWDNHDSVQHTVTATDASFDSGALSQGEAWSRVFDTEGEYAYYCVVHPSMQGVVRVEAPPPPPPPNAAPVIAFTAPGDGATVTGEVVVTGTASDEDGDVARVQVAVDESAFVDVDVAPEWAFTLDTRGLVEGVHVLTARVTDDAGATATATLNLTVDHPEFPDLVLDVVSTRGNAVQQVVSARVTNAGPVPAGAFTVRFEYAYKDAWHAIDAVPVTRADAGGTLTVSVEWDTTLKLGAFPVRALADAANAVVESDESNNAGAGRAIVGAGVPAVDATDP